MCWGYVFEYVIYSMILVLCLNGVTKKLSVRNCAIHCLERNIFRTSEIEGVPETVLKICESGHKSSESRFLYIIDNSIVENSLIYFLKNLSPGLPVSNKSFILQLIMKILVFN